MSLLEELPSFIGAATTYDKFRAAYSVAQCVSFRRPVAADADNKSKNKGVAALKAMLDTFENATPKDQASWCIETKGDDSISLLPLEFLLPTASTQTKEQKAYCSYVLQDDSNQSVRSFTKQHAGTHATLPVITNDRTAIHVADPYWMFIGRNTTRASVLKGRSEHTDGIQHDGTFHYQMAGTKTWKLRPTAELRDQCDHQFDVALKDSYSHTVEEGDMFLINTRLWWHQTEIAGIDDDSGDDTGLSISFARDLYLDGSQLQSSNDDDDPEHMSSVDGAFANATIPNGTVLLTELEELPSTIGRSNDRDKANCEIVELLDDIDSDDDFDSDELQMALVATREIVEGEFFILFDDEATS